MQALTRTRVQLRCLQTTLMQLKNLFTMASTRKKRSQMMLHTDAQLVPAAGVPKYITKALRSSNLSRQHIEEVKNLINKSETVITEVEAQMEKIEAAISRKDSEIRALKEENLRLSRISGQAEEQPPRKQISGPSDLYGEIGEARDHVFQPDGDVVDATSAVKELR